MVDLNKAEFLKTRGWSQWYNDNYWVNPKHTRPGIDHTYCGLNTDEAYAFETDPVSRQNTLNGQELYFSALKVLSNLGNRTNKLGEKK